MQSERLVVVTGATGFVGKHVISQLLNKGFKVRGTIRTAAKADAVKATIRRTNGDEGLSRLELHVADLMSDDGWANAMKGASALMHVAAMVYAREPKDPELVIGPAIEGTSRVLRYAHDAGISRIVMTSSIATVGYGNGNPKGLIHIDETNWTDVKALDGSWSYAEGKTRAERHAWEFTARHDIGLTTIHPGMILGPAMDSDASASLEFVEMCLSGKVPALPPAGFCIVDVRDVAEMHVAALLDDESIGHRYLATGPYSRFIDAASILAANYPNAKVPTRVAPAWIMKFVGRFDRTVRQIAADIHCVRHFDGSKGAALMGHGYRSPEEALVSSAESLIEFGVIDESKVH